MAVENVGNGVIEFVFEGQKYDAFEFLISNGQVHLFVKQDNLDTLMSRGLKQCRRYMRTKGQKVKPSLFNFYFTPPIRNVKLIPQYNIVEFMRFVSNYSDIQINLDSPPPKVLN